jgi:hypothetical protein
MVVSIYRQEVKELGRIVQCMWMMLLVRTAQRFENLGHAGEENYLDSFLDPILRSGPHIVTAAGPARFQGPRAVYEGDTCLKM